MPDQSTASESRDSYKNSASDRLPHPRSGGSATASESRAAPASAPAPSPSPASAPASESAQRTLERHLRNRDDSEQVILQARRGSGAAGWEVAGIAPGGEAESASPTQQGRGMGLRNKDCVIVSLKLTDAHFKGHLYATTISGAATRTTIAAQPTQDSGKDVNWIWGKPTSLPAWCTMGHACPLRRVKTWRRKALFCTAAYYAMLMDGLSS